jgi:hypothetical protein
VPHRTRWRNRRRDDLPAGWADVNAEQVAAWNPDVILPNAFEDALELSRVPDGPILSLTAAAQSGRVCKMPLGGYRWDPPDQESPLSWLWLANLLHPEVFDHDLRAEMRTAYRMLYGHDLTDAEIDEIRRIVARIDGRTEVLTVILAGMIVGALFAALVSILQFVADPNASLPAIVCWLMGAFSTTTWERLGLASPGSRWW